ncbi:MAG: glycosyltransferase family 2 protein [Burkholderiaceae bacterium]
MSSARAESPPAPRSAPAMPEARGAKVAVVVLNFNGWVHTRACVESLLRMTVAPAYVIVCDNDSSDGSVRALGDAFGVGAIDRADAEAGGPVPGVTLIRTGANLGFAGGNNVGIRHALSDPALTHVWVLNNDTEVDRGALEALLRAVRLRPEIAMWGTTLVDWHRRDRVQALAGGVFDAGSGQTRHIGAFTRLADVRPSPAFVAGVEDRLAYVQGASMFVSRRWIETVGLLSESFFLYYEELDWAYRARGRLRMGYAPDALVYHREGASIGTAPTGGSPLSVYHLHRSRVLFCRRHLSRPRVARVLGASIASPLKFCLRGRPALARAALAGLLAGCRVSGAGATSGAAATATEAR